MKHYWWVLLEKAGLVAIKVFSIALLARVLRPADFGLYAMVAVIVAVGTMLAESGMAGSLIRKPDATELDYSTVFVFSFAASLLLYAVNFLAAPAVVEFYGQAQLTTLLRVVAALLALGVAWGLAGSLFNALSGLVVLGRCLEGSWAARERGACCRCW